MGNLIQGLAANAATQPGRTPATSRPAGTTTTDSPVVQTPAPTPPVTTPKQYKPPVPKDAPSVVTERFKVLLAKCPSRSREETIDKFKGILVREPPKPVNNLMLWVCIAIVVFIIIGIGIWYYNKNNPTVPEKLRPKKTKYKSPTASIKKEIAKSSPLTEA